jgi:hypothetical protein
MGYRLIVLRGRYKGEMKIEMNGEQKGQEVRRQRKCVGGGEQ